MTEALRRRKFIPALPKLLRNILVLVQSSLKKWLGWRLLTGYIPDVFIDE